MTTTKNRRTDPKTEQLVITKIALGMKYQEIYEEVGVPVSTIKKIKRRNLELLVEVRHKIIEKDAETAARIHHKAHALLERHLDKALAGKEDVPLKDLVAVDREMFHQTQVEKNDPTENKYDDISPERAEALRLAMETDDMVELMPLLFPQNSNTYTQR